MRWLSKRPFGTLIVFSFVLLFLTAACSGPQGAQGQPGGTGGTGATGAAGSQGPGGSSGSDGAAGNMGPNGPTGPTGPSGIPGSRGAAGTDAETLPVSIVIVPAGEDTSEQPVIIDVSTNSKPELTIIGAGFDSGQKISANIISATGESVMQFSGGSQFTGSGGAFSGNWRSNADLVVGVYTIEVTASGIKASAPLVMITK